MFWIWRTYWLEGIGKLFSSKTRLFTLFFFFEARLFTLFVHHILGKNILSSILYFFYLNLPHFQCNLYTISKGLFGYAFATHECAFWGLDRSFLSFTMSIITLHILIITYDLFLSKFPPVQLWKQISNRIKS
jgi:hypothetical protein